MQRTGLFGGTFDPLHNGHLQAALMCREILDLDRLVFIPACIPPHKTDRMLSAPSHRLAMLRAALAEYPGLEYSDIEIQREGMSFTIDTVRAFVEPGTELYFITGSDSLAHLHLWKDVEKLSDICRVTVISRPGFSLEVPSSLRETLSSDALSALKAQTLEIAAPAVSSTMIRSRVAAGEDISDLVPAGVAEYIQQHGLYG